MKVFSNRIFMLTEAHFTISLLGGAFMAIIGITYLVFEDWVLSDFSSSKTATASHVSRPINRALVGAQVGLVILSMVVTRSSVLSLQARQGLPLGNQVAGLFVLCELAAAAPRRVCDDAIC